MTTASDPWGRVDDDGTVYVRTAEGERVIGSWQAGSPEEALAFFQRKYDVAGDRGQPARAAHHHHRPVPRAGQATITRLLESVADAHAVGDLDGLRGRLEALTGLVDHRREEDKAAREQARSEAQERQGADRRRGRADRRRGHPLEDQRRADAPAAGGVEGRAAGRPGGGDRAVEAAVGRAQRVHQAPQGLLRQPGGRARGGQDPQGAAGHRGRGAVRLDRLGPHRRGLPRPHAAVEGGGPRRPGRRGGAVGAVQGRPGHVLRRPRQDPLGQGRRAARARRRPRPRCWPRRRSCCR